MLETTVAIARFLQFAAATALFGAPLFLLYAPTGFVAPTALQSWMRTLIRVGAATLLAGAAITLCGQTATMAGDPAMALDPDTLGAVLTGTNFGYAIVARLLLVAPILALGLALRPGRRLWRASSALGALAVASFAWTGHGASEEGLSGVVHALADIVHLLAAGVWLGALAALILLLSVSRRSGDVAALHAGLRNFSGVGSLVVASLLVSGLVNSWFLVGLSRLGGLTGSPYGWLLLAKVGLFALMLLLAAANRFRLTPALGQVEAAGGAPTAALRALLRSLYLEFGLGLGVLALVSVLGLLEPIAAQA